VLAPSELVQAKRLGDLVLVHPVHDSPSLPPQSQRRPHHSGQIKDR
jgi:hypothetical protein